MDVSDGLVADLGKLCAASVVSAAVDAYRLPVHDLLKESFPGRWLEFALGGGEDYEIVFTASNTIMSNAVERLGDMISVIGKIENGEGQVSVFDEDGKAMEVTSSGWDHFLN